MRTRRLKEKGEKTWYKVDSKKGVYYTNIIGYKTLRFIVRKDDIPAPSFLLEAIEKIEKEHDEPLSNIYAVDGVYQAEVKKKESAVELPSGTYNFLKEDYVSGLPERLVPVDFRTDKYVNLPNSTSEEIVKELKSFLQNEQIYRKLDCIYKSGFLLYGDPGNGKTALIRNIVREHLPKDSVVINISDVLPGTEFLTAIKETLGNRLKVFILEEFTSFTKDLDGMDEILTFLDGENSLDRSVIFGTTNYPDVLPGNIVERPSRFDNIYEVSSPEKDSRKLLLNYYLNREVSEDEIKITDGLSSDAIKNICILSIKKDISINEASNKIKKHLKIAKDKFRKVGKLGF